MHSCQLSYVCSRTESITFFQKIERRVVRGNDQGNFRIPVKFHPALRFKLFRCSAVREEPAVVLIVKRGVLMGRLEVETGKERFQTRGCAGIPRHGKCAGR